MLLLSSADFFQKHFKKDSFWNTDGVTSSLDLDQAQRSVGPDLGPNCLQRLSAVGKSRCWLAELVNFVSHLIIMLNKNCMLIYVYYLIYQKFSESNIIIFK